MQCIEVKSSLQPSLTQSPFVLNLKISCDFWKIDENSLEIGFWKVFWDSAKCRFVVICLARECLHVAASTNRKAYSRLEMEQTESKLASSRFSD